MATIKVELKIPTGMTGSEFVMAFRKLVEEVDGTQFDSGPVLDKDGKEVGKWDIE